jgi:hypothetical protein
MDEIEIAIAADEAYLPGLLVTAATIWRSCRLTNALTDAHLKELKELSK